MGTGGAVVEVEGLTKRYGRFVALDGLTLTVGGGPDPGLHRAQRRREDHGDQNPGRAGPAHQRFGQGRGRRLRRATPAR